MLLDELGTLLQAQGIGTLAQTLFIGEMPDGPGIPDAVVALIETGGPGPTDTMGNNTPPAWENPTFQVLSRGDKPDPTKTPYLTARTKARDAWNALTLVANESLSSTRYLRISPLQSPFLIGRDSSERPLIGFNCIVQKVPS